MSSSAYEYEPKPSRAFDVVVDIARSFMRVIPDAPDIISVSGEAVVTQPAC